MDPATVIYGRVLLVPVDREAESVEELLVSHLIFRRDHMTELDEIFSRYYQLLVFVQAELFPAPPDVEVSGMYGTLGSALTPK